MAAVAVKCNFRMKGADKGMGKVTGAGTDNGKGIST